MASASTTISSATSHTTRTGEPDSLSSLLDISDALLRASDMADGVRHVLNVLVRWPGVAGGRVTLRPHVSGSAGLEQTAGEMIGSRSVQAFRRAPRGPGEGPLVAVVELSMTDGAADEQTAAILGVVAAMLAQAARLSSVRTEHAKLHRQAQRASMAAGPSGAGGQVIRKRRSSVPPPSLSAAIGACEKDVLVAALQSAAGNRAQAARLLSTTERIFNYKVRKHGIDWRQFRHKR